MKQKLLTILMLALLMPAVARAYTNPVKIDGIYYNISSTEAVVTNSNGGNPNPADPYIGDVVIPESIVFSGKSFPIKTIGLQAFYGSPQMTSVDIPATVTKCETSAFASCWGLKRVNIHDFEAWCKISFAGDWSNPLYSCFHLYLNGEEMSDFVIPSSITTINNSAFAGCKSMKTLVIPNTVTSIGSTAFSYCDSVKSVVIPNSVTSIGSFAFRCCHSMESLTLPDKITSIGQCTFEHCYSLKSVVIPDSVTTIGDQAFRECYALESVTLPAGLISIGYDAFEHAAITSIEFPNTLTTIDKSAFRFCEKLEGFHIPSSVEYIGANAFDYCYELRHISVGGENPSYDSRGNCNALIETSSNILLWGSSSTVIPNTVISVAPRAFYYNKYLSSIDIPNSVISIGYGAFNHCEQLSHLTLGNSLKTIGNNAFEYCAELTSVNISNSVTNIGEKAFNACSKLSDLTIGSSVDTIGQDAFRTCNKLMSITVASDNQRYDSRDNCNALIETASNTLLYGSNNAFIPNTVTSIADKAFAGKKDLADIDIPGSVTTIGAAAFGGCVPNTLTIHEGVTTIGDNAFQNCDKYTSLIIPNSVTSIGRMAFYDNDDLLEATIGNGVTALPERMFYSCSKVKKLTIGSSVDTIGSGAFGVTYQLTDVTCLAATPPRALRDVFTRYDATLRVPASSVEAYRAAYPWSEFANIVGFIYGGDLNDDGELNINDVTEIINLLLTGGELPACADVNGDGVVNISDVTELISYLLNE